MHLTYGSYPITASPVIHIRNWKPLEADKCCTLAHGIAIFSIAVTKL